VRKVNDLELYPMAKQLPPEEPGKAGDNKQLLKIVNDNGK
jgi:hypothetical protein